MSASRRAFDVAAEAMGDLSGAEWSTVWLRVLAACDAIEEIRTKGGHRVADREEILASAFYASLFGLDYTDVHHRSYGGGRIHAFAVALRREREVNPERWRYSK